VSTVFSSANTSFCRWGRQTWNAVRVVQTETVQCQGSHSVPPHFHGLSHSLSLKTSPPAMYNQRPATLQYIVNWILHVTNWHVRVKCIAKSNKTFIDIRLRPGIAPSLLPYGPLQPNVTSSIKLEVHNVSQRWQGRTEPWPQESCKQNFVKIGPAVPEMCSQTDRQQDPQYSAPLPGQSNNSKCVVVISRMSSRMEALDGIWSFDNGGVKRPKTKFTKDFRTTVCEYQRHCNSVINSKIKCNSDVEKWSLLSARSVQDGRSHFQGKVLWFASLPPWWPTRLWT